MRCFFYGFMREKVNGDTKNGIVSFSIPDIGLSFKAAVKGNEFECQYAGLLALLEFIDLNPHLFKNQRIDILGDSFIVIHQVNLKLVCSKDLEPFRNLALGYKKKFDYNLAWVPKNQNPAYNPLTISPSA